MHVDTQGTGTLPDSLIAEVVRRSFRLNPSGIIKHLDLRRPIYRKTASGGHFGRSEPEFTWEKTDKAQPASRGSQHFRAVDAGLIDMPSEGPVQLATAEFTARFGGEPAVTASAPGRVELLGNHTDYNGGLVIAAAIDRRTVCVGRRSTDRLAKMVSVHFNGFDTFSLDDIKPTELRRMDCATFAACAGRLSQWRGPLSCGFEAVIAGDVPLGAGLSSSASLQAAFAAVPDRTRCRAGLLERGIRHGTRRCAPTRAGTGVEAIGKRVRRRGLGVARPVLEPLRTRRLRAVPRLPHARIRPAAARPARPGHRRLRLEDLAPAGRRDVRPPARSSAIGSSPRFAAISPTGTTFSSHV